MTDQPRMILLSTNPCPHCHERGQVLIPEAEWFTWDFGRGPHIQVAMPSLSADEREMILTGTHPACWAEMFPEEDEEYPEDGELLIDLPKEEP